MTDGAARPRRLLGAVLAGGESRRLGRDKAVEVVGGMRMIDRAVTALTPHCDRVVVVSSRAAPASAGWTYVADLRPGCGPLGGIESALARATESGMDGVVVLAVDLPLVDAEQLRVLVRAYDAHARSAGSTATPVCVAAARDGDPPFEPLCAVYSSGCLSSARALLDDGQRAARALFRAVDGHAVRGVAGARQNVNDEADLAAVVSELEAGR